MNKSYKVLFNRVRGVATAVSEIASGNQARKKAAVTVAVAMAMGMMTSQAIADPSNDAGVVIGTGSDAGTVNQEGFTYQVSEGGGDPEDYPTTASGSYSTAMGVGTTASGKGSTAMGVLTIASGAGSTAMGMRSQAVGIGSFAGGVTYYDGSWPFPSDSLLPSQRAGIALGIGSFAFGSGAVAGATEAEYDDVLGRYFYDDDHDIVTYESGVAKSKLPNAGSGQIAMGDGAWANETNAVAIGSGAQAVGGGSTAIGSTTTALGDGSTAMGSQTIASGLSSTAMGVFTIASGLSSTAMGESTIAGAWTDTDGVVGEKNKVYEGNWSTAMGFSTMAVGNNSTAMGANTIASGDYSTAMGGETIASGEGSTAMGLSTKAVGNYSTAMGLGTKAVGGGSTAMGGDTIASGEGSTAMGHQTKAVGYYSTATGTYSQAVGTGSSAGGYGSWNGWYTISQTTRAGIALGTGSYAFGTGAVAGNTTATPDESGNYLYDASNDIVEYDTTTGIAKANESGAGSNQIAMGYLAWAKGDNSVAIGPETKALGHQSIAIGCGATASEDFSTAMGYGTTSSGGGSTAMGIHTTASGDGSTASGAGTTASGEGSTAMGDTATASGIGSTALGYNTLAGAWEDTEGEVGEKNKEYEGNYSTAMGSYTIASGEGSTAMGNQTKAVGNYSTAMGSYSLAAGNGSFAGGYGISDSNRAGIALGESSFAFGTGAQAGAYTSGTTIDSSKNHQIAIGLNSKAYGDNSLALIGGTANGENAVAIGKGATAAGNAVALGTNSVAAENTVSVGYYTSDSVKLYRRITNVAAGTTANDVATYGQILDSATYADNTLTLINTQGGTIATVVITAGSGGAPEYIAATKYNSTGNVASAKADSATTGGATAVGYDSSASESYATAVGYGATASHENSVALGRGSVTAEANEVSVGNTTTKRKITNVASAGELSKSNTNAATGADVYNATTIVGDTAHNYYTGTTTNPTSVISAVNALDTQVKVNTDSIATVTAKIGADITEDGTYIKSSTTKSVNENIQALDEALTTMNTTVTEVSTLAENSVQYDSATNSVTFAKGTSAVIELKNVANGTVDSSAATVGQVKSYTSIKVGGETVTSSANGIEFVAGENIQIDTTNNKLTISSLGGADTLAVHYAENSSNKLALTDNGSSVLIGNVAAGTVSETSTDAVNGSQLYAVDAKIGADIATDGAYIKKSATNSVNANIQALDAALGKAFNGDETHSLALGGATLGSNTQYSLAIGPETTVTGSQSIAIGYQNTVSGDHSGAFGDPNTVSGTGSYVFGNNNAIAGNNVFVLGSNVSASADVNNAVVLGNDSVAVSNAVSVGSSTNQRQIKYVAAPTEATDAANKQYVDNTFANATASVANLDSRLTKKINRLGAKSAAISALHPMGLDEDHKVSASAGVGTYGGQAAAAVGVFYKPNENWMFNIGGAAGRGSVMGNIGVNYRFGAASSVKTMTPSQVAARVVAMQDTNRSIEAQLKASLSREEGLVQQIGKSEQRHQTEMAQLKKTSDEKIARLKKTSNARIAKLEKQNAQLMKDFAKMKTMMLQLAAQQKK